MGRKIHRALLGLAASLALGCAASPECGRLCKEATQACTDPGVESRCLDRCDDPPAGLSCAGHGSCSGGLCCLGFYYVEYEQARICGG
jgi:hypothetical protein